MTRLITDFKILMQIFVHFVLAEYDDFQSLINTLGYHWRITQGLQRVLADCGEPRETPSEEDDDAFGPFADSHRTGSPGVSCGGRA